VELEVEAFGPSASPLRYWRGWVRGDRDSGRRTAGKHVPRVQTGDETKLWLFECAPPLMTHTLNPDQLVHAVLEDKSQAFLSSFWTEHTVLTLL
jgi:hypothetical protein